MGLRTLVTGGSGFIGTNLIAALRGRDWTVANFDLKPPVIEAHAPSWRRIDTLDRAALAREIAGVEPTHIVHLAALATFKAGREELATQNVTGTANVLDAALALAGPVRVIVASTQYVNGPGTPFDDDLDFHPVNDYGASKAEAELLLRSAKYDGLDWIIVRPTNIWGPFHPTYPHELWRYIRRGLYMHPGRRPIVRAYGYVENIASQIAILLTAPSSRVRHRVFYLTDPPIDSFELLNKFSFALRSRSLPRVPLPLLSGLAKSGDLLKRMGFSVPFYSERLSRMTTEHGARYETLWAEHDYRPVVLEDGIARTAAWLRQTYPARYR